MPITSAKELRAIQAKHSGGAGAGKEATSEKDKEAAFKERFGKACNLYYETLMQVIEDKLEAAGKTSKTYVIVNDKRLDDKFEGLSNTTVLYGFWNKEESEFDATVFEKHGIVPPFERVVKQMKDLGYSIEDVSDSKRSLKTFLKVSW